MQNLSADAAMAPGRSSYTKNARSPVWRALEIGLIEFWLCWSVSAAGFAIFLISVAIAPEQFSTAALAWVVLLAGYPAIAMITVRHYHAAFCCFSNGRALREADFNSATKSRYVLGFAIGGLVGVGVLASLRALSVDAELTNGWVAVAGAHSVDVLLQLLESGFAQTLGLTSLVVSAGVIYFMLFGVAFTFGQIFLIGQALQHEARRMLMFNAGILAESLRFEHDDALQAGGIFKAMGSNLGARP